MTRYFLGMTLSSLSAKLIILGCRLNRPKGDKEAQVICKVLSALTAEILPE
jgi:hypothetical protein